MSDEMHECHSTRAVLIIQLECVSQVVYCSKPYGHTSNSNEDFWSSFAISPWSTIHLERPLVFWILWNKLCFTITELCILLTQYIWVRLQNYEKPLLACHVCASVHVAQLGSRRTDYHKFWYLSVFWKAVERIKLSLKSDGIVTGALHENLRTFTITSCWILLRPRNVSE